MSIKFALKKLNLLIHVNLKCSQFFLCHVTMKIRNQSLEREKKEEKRPFGNLFIDFNDDDDEKRE